MSRNRVRFWKVCSMGLLLLFSAFLVKGLFSVWVVEADQNAPFSAEEIEKEKTALERSLRKEVPKGHYIVIDTAANLLFVKKGEEVVLEAPCSTGSGRTLVGPQRSWTFETPRGEFRIRHKVVNPLWRKPDWAFLEEGEPVPSDESKRFERNVLGEYALGIGDGYFIHGTLYNRLLGQNVTHGCVRLGSEDLRKLVRLAPVGTRVFIF